MVIELDKPDAALWKNATIAPLVPEAPGSEVLQPGVEIIILEGPREVARFLIDK